jgi:hypothetical protein
MASLNLISPTEALPALLVGQFLATGAGTLLTVASNAVVKIEKGSICNTDTVSSHLVSIAVALAAAPSFLSYLIYDYPLIAGNSLPLGDYVEGLWLGPGDKLIGFANEIDIVVATFSGTVFT